MKKQQGFTLIELIVVIVILGILAATALPKFVDLQGDARRASVQALAAAVTSGSTMNYGRRLINGANGYAQTACDTTVAASAVEGGLPAENTYTVASSGAVVTTNGTPMNCIITDTTHAVSAVAYVPYLP